MKLPFNLFSWKSPFKKTEQKANTSPDPSKASVKEGSTGVSSRDAVHTSAEAPRIKTGIYSFFPTNIFKRVISLFNKKSAPDLSNKAASSLSSDPDSIKKGESASTSLAPAKRDKRLWAVPMDDDKRKEVLDFLNQSMLQSDKMGGSAHIKETQAMTARDKKLNRKSKIMVPKQYIKDYERSSQSVSVYNETESQSKVIKSDQYETNKGLPVSIGAIIQLCKKDNEWARYVMAYANQTSTAPLMEALMDEDLRLINRPKDFPDFLIRGAPESLSYTIDAYPDQKDTVSISIACSFPVSELPSMDADREGIEVSGSVKIQTKLLIPRPQKDDDSGEMICKPRFVNVGVSYAIQSSTL